MDMKLFLSYILSGMSFVFGLNNCFSQTYPIIRIDDNTYYTNSLDSNGCSSFLHFDKPDFKIVICMDKYYLCDFIKDTTYVRFVLDGTISLNHTTLSDFITIKNIRINGFINNNNNINKFFLGKNEIVEYDLFVDCFESILENIDICYSTRNNKDVDATSVYVPMWIWITFVPDLSHQVRNREM